ncbi:hypothetical protein [Enterocloster clostridioformis]|uniref:hypothetical protein n=1 Tax=Enterocloster clostridioformis TaxID=1531 RepID=UPI0034A238A6
MTDKLYQQKKNVSRVKPENVLFLLRGFFHSPFYEHLVMEIKLRVILIPDMLSENR